MVRLRRHLSSGAVKEAGQGGSAASRGDALRTSSGSTRSFVAESLKSAQQEIKPLCVMINFPHPSHSATSGSENNQSEHPRISEEEKERRGAWCPIRRRFSAFARPRAPARPLRANSRTCGSLRAGKPSQRLALQAMAVHLVRGEPRFGAESLD